MSFFSDEIQPLDKITSRSFQGVTPSLIQDISHVYQKNARDHFEKLMKTVGVIKSIRKVIREYILTNSASKEVSSCFILIKHFSRML